MERRELAIYRKDDLDIWEERPMAEIKKTAVAKPTAKAVAAKSADTKTAEAKTTPVVPAAKTESAEKKAEPKKETKAAAKKTTAAKKPAAKKAAEKKEPAKKETAAKKSTVKEQIQIQFAGKTYTTEDLVKIAKDVWKYDLGKKEADFKSVELYVKPEEHTVYYVINSDVTGSFGI
jgi:hypothetical protein